MNEANYRADVARLRDELLTCRCDVRLLEIIIGELLDQQPERQGILQKLQELVQQEIYSISSRSDASFLARLRERARRYEPAEDSD